MIKLLAAPVRSIVRFPLLQFAVVVAVILFLQAGNDNSARGQMFNGLDKLVESTVGLLSAAFSCARAWHCGFRTWVPFERIRPAGIPQEKWEEAFAWPANNEPPYPPLPQRILRGVISYLARSPDSRHVAPSAYSFSRPDLAWRADKNVGWLKHLPFINWRDQEVRRSFLPSNVVIARRKF